MHRNDVRCSPKERSSPSAQAAKGDAIETLLLEGEESVSPGCHYGEIGLYLSGRLGLKPDSEEKLQKRFKEIRTKLIKKLRRTKCDKMKRKYQRNIWVLNGFVEHDLVLSKLLHLNNTFKNLDLVPMNYHYPIFYEL